MMRRIQALELLIILVKSVHKKDGYPRSSDAFLSIPLEAVDQTIDEKPPKAIRNDTSPEV